MFDYRYEATRDGDGWLITFPDFTGVNTDGQSEDAIPQRARDALLTMLEHYMRTRTELPAPTFDGSTSVVAMGEIIDLKLMLYQGMVWNGVTQAELAKRLRTSPTLVSRLLDLDHTSKAEQIRAAMDAMSLNPRIDARGDPSCSVEGGAEPSTSKSGAFTWRALGRPVRLGDVHQFPRRLPEPPLIVVLQGDLVLAADGAGLAG